MFNQYEKGSSFRLGILYLPYDLPEASSKSTKAAIGPTTISVNLRRKVCLHLADV